MSTLERKLTVYLKNGDEYEFKGSSGGTVEFTEGVLIIRSGSGTVEAMFLQEVFSHYILSPTEEDQQQ